MRQRRGMPLFIALLSVLALLLAACGGDGTTEGEEPEDAAEQEDAGEQEAEEAADDEAAAGPFTIGVSNGFVGSEWRTQMIEDIESVFAEYEEQGLVDELIVESADVDVNGQIQQIRNLIAAGVDAIIVNPNSQTALNAVFEEAAGEGIVVISTDQAVTSDQVTNVVIDQTEWARISARWLAEQIGEGGQIVAVNGIAGHPANEDRWSGASEVFDEAGVEVLANANADWDQATGQQVMSDLLATYPDLDGVWTQDGMAEGVLRALIAADRLGDVTPTGEARAGYLRLWEENDLNTVGVVNPPGVAGSALRVAVYLLQGRELADDALTDGNTLFVPIPAEFTNDNLDEALSEAEGQPDSYSLDAIISDEEAQSYFQ
jgi:ribose transport system substrate-binding protein